jgi:hypothetical protein
MAAVLTNSIAAPAPANGTQFFCTGWTLAGHDPTNGAATNFTLTLTNDATLTWLWTTNYWLDTAAGPTAPSTSPTPGSPPAPPPRSPPPPTSITTSPTGPATPPKPTTPRAAHGRPQGRAGELRRKPRHQRHPRLVARASHGWTNDFDAAATNDPEPDGYFTWQEYIADTDPTNGASFFPPLEAAGSATNLAFGLDPTSTGRQYYIDVATPIDDPDWSNVTNAPGTGGAWLPEITPPGTGFFFYRGRVTLPP